MAKNFISDDDMDKMEASAPKKATISDAEMAKMEADQPSEIESGIRGALQGASMGFADEASGGIEALWEKAKGNPTAFGELYKQSRDESRSKNKLAEEVNPASYTTGQIGGAIGTSVIPGLGGATLGKLVAQGAAQGLGSSDADLTEGEYAKAATDTALGAGTGALAFGAGKALEGGVKLAGQGLNKLGQVASEGVESGSQKLLSKLGGVDDDMASMLTREFGDEGMMGVRKAAASGNADAIEQATVKALDQRGLSTAVTPDKITKGANEIAGSFANKPQQNILQDIGAFGGLEYLVPGAGKVYAGAKAAKTAYNAASNPNSVLKGYYGLERASALTSDAIARIAPSMGKYSKVLQEAAQRGGNSLAATDYVMSQQDPEYREMKRQALEQEPQEE